MMLHLLVFDELHKFPRWKNWLKEIYDVQKDRHSILLTGSARLDVYTGVAEIPCWEIPLLAIVPLHP